MQKYNLMSVILDKRSDEAAKFQDILTKHGCAIKMRLGLHEIENVCAEDGLIILLLKADKKVVRSLEKDLKSMKGVKVNSMEVN